jgi:hypothetical protein
MTRSPSRGGRDARSNPPRSLVALAALPFVLIGIVASKVVSGSSRRRHAIAEGARTDGAIADGATGAEEPSYRVELGDTVSEIAIRHGLPTAHVLAQNGLSWKTPIFPGQVIRLEPIPDDLEWPEAATVDELDGRAS